MGENSKNSIGRRAFLSLSGGAVVLAASLPARAKSLKAHSVFNPKPYNGNSAIFKAARAEFMFPPDVTYCNTGTLGAMPRDVLFAQTEGLKMLEAELPDWPYYQADGEPLTGYQKLEDIRADVGKFIGAQMDEIAITQNATMGMNFLANGMTFKAGDEILTTDQEHGGGVSPFKIIAKRYGAIVKEINLDEAVLKGHAGVLEAFEDALTPNTKVIMFSQITSGYGTKLPAKALCRLAKDKGVFTIVDGAQVMGQLPLDLQDLDCDAYVASPHKWLLGPKGTGVLYIRRSRQDAIWTTLASYAYDNMEDGAFRFMQYGTGSPALIYALRAALEFNRKIGVERIAKWNLALTKQLQTGLRDVPNAHVYSSLDPDFWAGVTTFGLDNKSGTELQDALWDAKIRVRAQGKNPRVRLSAHLYVNPNDINRTLDIVRKLGNS